MAFAYTSGNPDNLVGGNPAAMIDIRGPFYDLRTFLNSGVLDPIAGLKAPATAAANVTVGEVGQAGAIRAGHTLAATDFTAQGLAVPLGLWNLGDLTDASGNGRALTNKGSVPFGVGIGGAATTAAVFAGSTGQALYIADTGAADPFRIRTGSWGCWSRNAKRGTAQYAMSKHTASVFAWGLHANDGANAARCTASVDGSTLPGVTGMSDIADDRWHLLVATYDGTTLRLYVDAAQEGVLNIGGVIAGTTAPINIGAYAADGAVAASNPHYGRVDEAFVTSDVLSAEQIRNLYAVRLTHTLAQVPGDVRISVRRRRRGGPLATTDFPTTPVRLHNFTAGSLADQGTGGVALTANQGTGAIVSVAGADGALGGGYAFQGAHTGMSATDAGLPAFLTARSFGCWFKASSAATQVFFAWGTLNSADVRLALNANGTIQSSSAGDAIVGPVVNDGLWHQAVVIEDNAAGDGVKRKLYVDGRLVGGSTVLNAITLAGANRFRVGANSDGSVPLTGQLDGAFVHSVVLTGEQVRALYNKGVQELAPSPKDATDHVEALTSTDLLVVLDTIEPSDAVDLLVAP